jgi:hypothetical protein
VLDVVAREIVPFACPKTEVFEAVQQSQLSDLLLCFVVAVRSDPFQLRHEALSFRDLHTTPAQPVTVLVKGNDIRVA